MINKLSLYLIMNNNHKSVSLDVTLYHTIIGVITIYSVKSIFSHHLFLDLMKINLSFFYKFKTD